MLAIVQYKYHMYFVTCKCRVTFHTHYLKITPVNDVLSHFIVACEKVGHSNHNQNVYNQKTYSKHNQVKSHGVT